MTSSPHVAQFTDAQLIARRNELAAGGVAGARSIFENATDTPTADLLAKATHAFAKNLSDEEWIALARHGTQPAIVPLAPQVMERLQGGYSWNVPGTMKWWEIAIVAMT